MNELKHYTMLYFHFAVINCQIYAMRARVKFNPDKEVLGGELN
jgi:hypothetical protein